jgi:ribosomal protein S27AE
MQIIVEVGVDPASYVNEEYQRRVRAPSVCPNCGRAQALAAHGYYWRWVTALCGLVIHSELKNPGASSARRMRKADASPRNADSFNPVFQLKCGLSTHFFMLSKTGNSEAVAHQAAASDFNEAMSITKRYLTSCLSMRSHASFIF